MIKSNVREFSFLKVKAHLPTMPIFSPAYTVIEMPREI